MSEEVDTRVSLAGIELRNPVLTASGTFGYGTEFQDFMDLTRIGGFVGKSLTRAPRWGNPPPDARAKYASPGYHVVGGVYIALLL